LSDIQFQSGSQPDMTGHFGTVVPFLHHMSSKFSAPENLIREIRETVLGCTQGRLSEIAKKQGNPLSIKTISRLEDGTQVYARTTFTRAHQAINEALMNAGKPSMEFEKLFPKLLFPAAAKKPSVKAAPVATPMAKPIAQSS
jgi:hypothetical protein